MVLSDQDTLTLRLKLAQQLRGLQGNEQSLTQSFEKVLDEFQSEENVQIESRTEEVTEKIQLFDRFNVHIPVRINNWEDYHSTVTPGRHISTPSKEICVALGLENRPQTYDLFEANGQRASISACFGKPWHARQLLTFLRKDLLDKYLSQHNLSFFWAIWGEREFYSEKIGDREVYAKNNLSYKVFQVIRCYES